MAGSNVKDKGNLALMLIFVIGIGSVLPFNILLNATTFFRGKLDADSSFASFIVSYMGVASTLPNVFLQLYNSISGGSGSVKKKLFISIVIQIICFALICGVAFIDAIEHPNLFFYPLMLLAFIINAAGGMFQNLSFVLAANLPMKYTNANVTGSNVGGIISALAMLITLAVTDNELYKAIIYFAIAIGIVVAEIFVSNAYFRNPFYLVHLPENNQQENGQQDDQSGLDERSTQELAGRPAAPSPSLGAVFKECRMQLLNIFLTFYVSLLIFPAVQVDIGSVSKAISPAYFIAIFTFLNFNVFAAIGNAVTFWKGCPLVAPGRVWIFVVLRFLFIPFFLFCNYRESSRTLPVLIKLDTAYVLGGSLLGFTSGYFSSLGLMYAPRSVSKVEYAETAAKMGAFALICGIVLGISSAFGLPFIV